MAQNEWWAADVKAASALIPQERKSAADVKSTQVSTERTETLTPLDAEGVFLANQEKRRKLGLPVLTPAQEQADVARAWQRILRSVRSYADLEPSLLGRVEELIDFVTADSLGE